MTVSLISASGIALNSQDGSSRDSRTQKGRTYLLRLTDPTEDQSNIQISGLVPVPGDFHPTQSNLRVTSVQSARKAGQIWEWTPLYENIYTEAAQDRATESNPLLRPIVWHISPQHGKRVVEKNIANMQLTNTAGDVAFPLPEVPKTTAYFRGVKNVASLPNWYQNLTDKLNSDSFFIAKYGFNFPPKTLLFQPGEDGDWTTESGITYFPLHFQLIYQESWQWERVSAGFYYIDEEDGVKRRIMVDGEWATEQRPLKENGDLVTDPKTDEAFIQKDHIIETRAFAPILS